MFKTQFWIEYWDTSEARWRTHYDAKTPAMPLMFTAREEAIKTARRMDVVDGKQPRVHTVPPSGAQVVVYDSRPGLNSTW